MTGEHRAPEDLLKDVYDEELGLRLTNASIKPVHVANGLGRALVNRAYDTAPLTRLLRRYVRDQRRGVDVEKNPNEAIIGDFGQAFEAVDGGEIDLQRLSRLRSLAFDVLAADDAVFPTLQSFTLANERFLTRDPSDVRCGLFLARLLLAGPAGQTHAANCIRGLLATEDDAWTTLALPLLAFGDVLAEANSADSDALATKADHLFAIKSGRLQSPTLQRLRSAYDRLARFEQANGSKLNSLRRLVLFGCFVIHVHAISRWSEREPGSPRPPILLDLSDGTVVSVRDASRSGVRAAGDAIEGLIRSRFSEVATELYGDKDKGIRKALASAGASADIVTAYGNYREGGADTIFALTSALMESAFERAGSESTRSTERPIGALIELGRRAGYLTPWATAGRGGKLQKRYTVTAEFLETLIAATVEPSQPLDLTEFLNQLRENFGIMVGRPQDDSAIRANNLSGDPFGPPTSVNEEDLRENVERMRRLVVETGFAKSYADGRTIITTEPQAVIG